MTSAKARTRRPAPVAAPKTRRSLDLFWVLLLAAAVRACYAWFSRQSPFYEPILLDPAYYHAWAKRIVTGGGLADGVFYGLPLYPVFLAMCYKLSAVSVDAVKVIQALFGLVTVGLIYKTGEKLSGRAAGLIGAVLAAIYGPLFFHESILIPEAIGIPLYAGAFYAACVLWEKPQTKAAAVFGLLSGAALLTKAAVIPFVLVFAGFLALRRHAAKESAVLLAFFALMIAPVTAHNLLRAGDPVLLTSHAGFNFYIGNNPKAEGVFVAPEGTGSNVESQIEDSRAVAEREAGRPLKASEVSRYWSDKAWEFIRQNPGRFFWLAGRKLLLFFDAREISDVDDYVFSRNFNPMLRLPWPGFGVLGPLALAGLLVGCFRMRHRWLVWSWAAGYIGGLLFFFVNARYRLPLLGLFCALAGVVIADLVRVIRERRWPWVTAYAGALVLGVWIGGLGLVGTNWVRDYVNVGDIYQEKKDLDRAAEFYKKGLEIDPRSSKAALGLALVYTKTGREDEAKEYYQRSIEADPRSSQAFNNLGLWYDRAGDLKKAEECFRKAIDLKPGSSQAHNNLGMMYGKAGDDERAIAEFETALRLNPRSARAHTNLGLVLYRSGKREQAVTHWESALAIDPEFQEARRALERFARR